MTSDRFSKIPHLDPEPALSRPEELLELATQWAMSDTPAHRRSAADRAYYAAYLFSRDQLAAKRKFTPTYREEDKEKVEQLLKAIGPINVGNNLLRLRQARRMFTYDTGALKTQQTGRSLRNWLSIADSIIKAVQSLP